MKRSVSFIIAIYMCISLLASAGQQPIVFAATEAEGITSSNNTTATEYEEIPTVTANVYYGDFVWGLWYFDWNEDIGRRLMNGKLHAADTEAPLTTGQAYTHGDLVMIGLDQEVTFKKITLKSAAVGQMPYKFRLEYSDAALASPLAVPQTVTTIGEYTGYNISDDTITVELDKPITAHSLWLQALTSGAEQEPGATEWSVSEIHLYKENFNTVPNVPVNLRAIKSEEHSLAFSWESQNDNHLGFDIYRSDNENGPFEKVGTTDTFHYTDTGLIQGATYYYKVKTTNAIGESEFSDLLSMKTRLTVANLSISEANNDITLSWSQAEGASSYEVYRSTGKYSDYTLYAYSDTASFTDHTHGDKYLYYYKVRFIEANGDQSDFSDDVSLEGQLFGDTMTFYSPSDDPAAINRMTAETAVKMKPMAAAEFSNDRYAFMFKPGSYDINTIDVGYYTSVYGLGATPLETTVPMVQVSASEYNSLTNFWRSIENIGIDAGSPANEVMWAASQAAPARRLYVNGKLQFDDNQKYASGGYLADSLITGQTGSYSQQQYFLRNNVFTGGWFGGVWNMLFVGVDNAPIETSDWDKASYASYTVEEETPVIREKPFLYVDNSSGDYAVFVPAVRENELGVSWSEGNPGEGTSLSINDFYVAKASVDTAESINAALAQDKNVLLTPGIYHLDEPLKINNANTVLLGIGLATLIPTKGNDAIQIADVSGVSVAGILIDAGESGSEHLLQVGPEGASADHSDNPTLLSDVYTRIGGAVDGKAEVSVEINSSNVIGDHFWLWRADHGMAANSTGWTKNIANNGVIVNGDDVTIYGLFVEHFQEYQTLWNGENGRTYFYQSEIPYDPPYQVDYMSHDGTVKGYSSYKVADHVKSHYAVALGIYDVFVKNKEWVELENAMEVSDGTTVKHAAIVSLGANGGTNHIINGLGTGVKNGQAQKSGINLYHVERSPVTSSASYDGATGKLILVGKNYDATELNWSAIALSGQDGSLILDPSMIKDMSISWNTITIKLNTNAMKQLSHLFHDENGVYPNGIILSAGYMENGTGKSFELVVSGIAVTIPAQPASPSPSSPAAGSKAEIIVNGKTINAGEVKTENSNGKLMTRVVLNEQALIELLETAQEGIVLSITVESDSDVIAGELSAQLIKLLQTKSAVLELRTQSAAFTLPVNQLNIDHVMDRFNKDASLQDTMIRLEIVTPSLEIQQMVENAAKDKGLVLLVSPIDFHVFAEFEHQVEEMTEFKQFVERSIAVPDSVNPGIIPTGIVVEQNGLLRPIPTKMITIGGKLYAVMSSLSNSTYAVVSSPVKFTDVGNHWAEAAINNMGARMILNGEGGRYDPDQPITRAEFAVLLERALGLKIPSGIAFFTDIKAAQWFSGSVQAAYSYNLINGFPDGTFRPNAKLTREQAMLMISKAAQLTGLQSEQSSVIDEILSPYTDQDEISSWAKKSFIENLQAGIISGRSSHSLAPKGMMTRAEAAVLVERLLQLSELI